MKPCTCVVSGLATGPKDYRPTEPQKENREKEAQETLSHMRALLVSKHKRTTVRFRKGQMQVACQRWVMVDLPHPVGVDHCHWLLVIPYGRSVQIAGACAA